MEESKKPLSQKPTDSKSQTNSLSAPPQSHFKTILESRRNKVLAILLILFMLLLGIVGASILHFPTETTKLPEVTSTPKVSEAQTPTIKVTNQATPTITASVKKPITTTPIPPTQVKQQIQTPTATSIPTYSISGYVFHDTNSNGSKDDGEEGYANVTVTFLSEGKSVTTNSSGQFNLGGLKPGNYNLTTNGPGGVNGTTANPAFVTIAQNDANISFGFN